MNPADKFLIFFGLLDLFYGYPLHFGSIIHPQFFFLDTGYFDSVLWFGENNFFEIPKFFGSFQLFSAETSKSRLGLKSRQHPIFFKRLGILMKFYHKTLNLTNF